MKRFLVCTALVLALAAGTTAVPAQAAPSAAVVSDGRQVTLERVYGPLYAKYKARYPTQLNWNKNGCSIPWAAWGVDPATAAYGSFFTRSCDRHDFGYRNHKITGYSRKTVDDKLLSNMIYQCKAKDWPGPDAVAELPCLRAASRIYTAVRIFGGTHWP